MGRAFSVTWRRWGSWRGMDRCGPAARRKCIFNRLTEKGLEYLEFLDLRISNKEGLSYLHAGPGQGVLKSVST